MAVGAGAGHWYGCDLHGKGKVPESDIWLPTILTNTLGNVSRVFACNACNNYIVLSWEIDGWMMAGKKRTNRLMDGKKNPHPFIILTGIVYRGNGSWLAYLSTSFAIICCHHLGLAIWLAICCFLYQDVTIYSDMYIDVAT